MKTPLYLSSSFFCLLVLLCITAPLCSFAQGRIIRQNGATVRIYNSLDSAIIYSYSGDTLYLSGGVFSTGTTMIDKTLYIFGAGHDLDSTNTTGRTIINGNLTFVTGSSYSLLSGLRISGIQLGINSSDIPSTNVSHLTIEKCSFYELLYRAGGSNSLATNFLIRNCIFSYLSGVSLGNHGVYNCFVSGVISGLNNSILNNNVFFYYCPYCPSNSVTPLASISNNYLNNNIFVHGWGMYNNFGGPGNYFNNNILNYYSMTTTNTYTNNYNNISYNSIFVNYSGFIGNNGAPHSPTDDYHLLNPNLYLGTDNTQVGVYGGLYPWRDGSMPRNPYIRQKSVQQISNNGLLNVNFEVQAFED